MAVSTHISLATSNHDLVPAEDKLLEGEVRHFGFPHIRDLYHAPFHHLAPEKHNRVKGLDHPSGRFFMFPLPSPPALPHTHDPVCNQEEYTTKLTVEAPHCTCCAEEAPALGSGCHLTRYRGTSTSSYLPGPAIVSLFVTNSRTGSPAARKRANADSGRAARQPTHPLSVIVNILHAHGVVHWQYPARTITYTALRRRLALVRFSCWFRPPISRANDEECWLLLCWVDEMPIPGIVPRTRWTPVRHEPKRRQE